MRKILLTIIFLLISSFKTYGEVINDIKVINNDRISKEAILVFSNIEKGKDYSQNDLNEIIKELSDCVGVIAGTESYTKDVIDALPNLKVISRLGVGTDNINLDFSYSKGIKIFTTK